jgi:hypothetical protein
MSVPLVPVPTTGPTGTPPCTEVFISQRYGALGGFISATLNSASPESIEMIYDTLHEFEKNESERLKRQRRRK